MTTTKMLSSSILLILLLILCISYSTSLIQRSISTTHQLSRFTDRSKSKRSTSSLLMSSSPSPKQSNVNISEKKTFKRFMEVELWRTPELDSLFPILCSIETACRDINRLMRRISTDNLTGYNSGSNGAGSVNIQGEDQKKLDVIANRIMKISLCCSGKVSIVASEEDDEPCLCSAVTSTISDTFTGEYAAVFDPLDGSSNIDSGLPTGTIFGVYKNPSYGIPDPMKTVTQRGNNLVVAGYCLYSAATHLVITLRTGLHMFTLDDVTGEFYLTRSNLRIPRIGPIYSFNDAKGDDWEPGTKNFLKDLKAKRIPGLTEYGNQKEPTSRYMGALVADAHNILLNGGGVYGYPGTLSSPRGKLRLLYEANPLALILEEAGGSATNGRRRILDLQVNSIHERTPLFIGSADLVSALTRYNSFYDV